MTPILALGPHVFEILPLSLQQLDEVTRAKWPAVSRFGRAPARQYTGRGEDSLRVEGLIFNEEFGGFEDYLALKQTQRQPEPVDMIGWGSASGYARVFGPVVLLEVGATHEYLGTSGVGRKISFHVVVAPFGDDGIFGGLF
jgi:phage protein U